MKATVKAFLARIREKNPPPREDVLAWLKKQNLTAEEAGVVTDAVEEVYSLTPQTDLTSEILSTKYVDDFRTLMNELDMRGWIPDYVEHTNGMEAPTAFHFGTALTILGASMRRRVFVDQGYYKIWPAMQTLLIGPSGKVKKSTAGGYGVGLGLMTDSKLYNLLPDEGSGEALKTELAQLSRKEKEATGLLYVSELSTFLGNQDYNKSLVQTLTDLFDSRGAKRRRTSARGNEEMANIALSFLGCSNEEWLGTSVPPSAFGGGLFGRMLVFYQADTDRYVPRPKPPADGVDERLSTDLVKVRFTAGEAVLTAPADRWYDEEYRRIKNEWPEDERLIPFHERRPDHLLRVGMLLSISENLEQRSGVIVRDTHLIQASRILDWIVRYLPGVYAHLGGSQFGTDHERIYSIIYRNGGSIENRELGRRMSKRLDRNGLDNHLETMRLNGVLERIQVDPWEGKIGWKIIRALK
jgi:hypothetical protein